MKTTTTKNPTTHRISLPMSVPQCRQTRLNGLRCGAPALRGQTYCHYHTHIRTHQRRHSCAEAREIPLQLPPLEDAHSIQLALMEIGQAILHDRISDKKAGLLLYMLQNATLNLKRLEEDHTEELVRQDYPEAVAEMERLKQDAARDPDEEKEDSLASLLLHQLGIHPDDPPQPPPPPPDDEPLWWEIQAGFKQPKPNSPQRTQRNTEEKSVASAQSPVASSSQPATDSTAAPQQPGDLPPLKFLSQRVEDIRGMADVLTTKHAKNREGETATVIFDHVSEGHGFSRAARRRKNSGL